MKIKVVEKGAKPVKSTLKKSNVAPQLSCGVQACILCKCARPNEMGGVKKRIVATKFTVWHAKTNQTNKGR